MDLRPVVTRLSSFGALPQDSEAMRMEKGLLVLGNLAAAVVQGLFALIYGWLGIWTGVWMVFGFACAFLANLVVFRFTRTSRGLFRRALVTVLVSVTWGQWLLGGYPPAQSLAIWAMMVPLVAATLGTPREAWLWLLAYFCVTIPAAYFHADPPAVLMTLPAWMGSTFFVVNACGMATFGFLIFYQIVIQRQYAMDALSAEHARSESLLLNILPGPIAERLKAAPGTIAERFESVTILFADIVGFTTLSAQVSPEKLVAMLDDIFSDFDALAQELRLEKIKTIGDAYMVVGGLPERRPDHADAVAAMAIGMLRVIERHAKRLDLPLNIRIGMHSGTVVAGVIGKRKFSYDLWGDAVNTASRMESHSLPGRIQLTDSTRAKLDARYVMESRGVVDVKGKGEMETWFLVGRR